MKFSAAQIWFGLGALWGMWFYHDAAPIYARADLSVGIMATAILFATMLVVSAIGQSLWEKAKR